jgi:hypothetical protein
MKPSSINSMAHCDECGEPTWPPGLCGQCAELNKEYSADQLKLKADIGRFPWHEFKVTDLTASQLAALLLVPVGQLGWFTTRVINGFHNAGITNLAELTTWDAQRLSKIKNIGPASVSQIRLCLDDYGLSLSTIPKQYGRRKINDVPTRELRDRLVLLKESMLRIEDELARRKAGSGGARLGKAG